MSKFQTRNNGGRSSGKLNEWNHNENNHKRQRGSNNTGIKLDGVWITNHYYKDFAKLTTIQKDMIRELKKDPKFKSKNQISWMNTNTD